MPGLEALQKAGVTERIWRRLTHDQQFLNAVAGEIVKLDVSLRGEAYPVKIEKGMSRASIYRQLVDSGRFRHGGILKESIIRKLSERAHERPKTDPYDYDLEVPLFLIPTPYRMSLDEGLEELEERNLMAANTEEALLFALRYEVPKRGSVVALKSMTIIENEISALDISRVVVGNPTIGLDIVERGIQSGTILLARELPDLREH